jgi:hypothetical protein
MKVLARAPLRRLRRLIKDGRWPDDPYGWYLLHGVRAAFQFAIDRHCRLFRTDRPMASTAANAITAPRDDPMARDRAPSP